MRTGRFGRAPRSVPNLNSTLIAIAREFENQRAQNIMDAWQKGGMFEGQKATDEKVLQFWKDRVKLVSKDDPLYDTYTNARSQLDYTIHESKMTAQYALSPKGPGDDQKMIAFYLGWAKKVPKDSEFYRVLQRDAGQYMRVRRASGVAAQRAAEEAAYQKAQAGTRASKEAAGEYVIDTIRRIAQSGNASQGIAPAIGAPGSGSDLTDFDPSDPDIMLRLLKTVAPDGVKVNAATGFVTEDNKFKASTETLYHDDDGKPVTGVDIMKKLSTLDKGFSDGAAFDVNYVTGLLDRQMQGINERIARAQKTGHLSDANSLLKSKDYISTLSREVGDMPVQKAYNEARADYDSVKNDPTASPQAVLNAWDRYSAQLVGFSKDRRVQADDNFRARIVAEINGDSGVPTLHESFTGLATGAYDAGSAKDAADNKAHMDFLRTQVDAVKNGAAVWTYGTTKGGVFTPQAGGKEIGPGTPETIAAGGQGLQMVTIPDARGGSPITLAITAVPVIVTAKDPATGDALQMTNSNPVAWAYDFPNGSGFTTRYGFTDKNGKMVFSDDPPWGPQHTPTASAKNGNHLEVDLTDEVARTLGYGDKDPQTGLYRTKPANPNVDQDFPTGVHVRSSTTYDDHGNPTGIKTQVDPQTLAWSSGDRPTGIADPASDFASLTFSFLHASPEGMSILNNLDKNPAYDQQLTRDAYQYAGAKNDPAHPGQYLPDSINHDDLNTAMMQNHFGFISKSLDQFVNNALTLWDKKDTPDPSAMDYSTPMPPVAKFASDLVQGTPFQALGAIFQPGTLKLASPQVSGQTGFTIKPVGVIKTPTVNPTTGFTTSTYTPPASATQAPSYSPPQYAMTQPQPSYSQAPSYATTQQSSAPPPPSGHYGPTRS